MTNPRSDDRSNKSDSAGAVHLYIGFPSQGNNGYNYFAGNFAALYLGTGERAPRVSRRRSFRHLQNDLAGDEPFDWAFMGTNMMVTLRMTRWDENVLRGVEYAANPLAGIGSAAAGIENLGDVGRLMITEARAVQLWVLYSYSAAGIAPKGAFSGGAGGGPMRNGWHFYAAFQEQDDHDGGTDPAVKSITFRCARVYNPATGQFVIYDDNMAGIAGVIPT